MGILLGYMELPALCVNWAISRCVALSYLYRPPDLLVTDLRNCIAAHVMYSLLQ